MPQDNSIMRAAQTRQCTYGLKLLVAMVLVVLLLACAGAATLQKLTWGL